MEGSNGSSQGVFILLGLSDKPYLEKLLFVVFLITYIVTLLGNLAIIVVSRLDPSLHTPMYFFLSNLSLLDICYTTSTVPQMLVNFRSTLKTISWAGCVAQLFIFLGLGSIECVLLAVMAYDRYAAVCQPLRYTSIMNHRLCWLMASASWLSGITNSLVQTSLLLRVPLCGRNRVDHFFCEVPALLELACADTSTNEIGRLVASVVLLPMPLGLILVSYGYIGAAVMKIRSAEGRRKAFNTCTSHLMVVSLFYGTATYMYMQPPFHKPRNQSKLVSLCYGLITPMLNPLIYTLRNKDVHGALRRIIGKQFWMQRT
ncbi:putative olfactory receptor 2B8 [Alligator mississippiensis]|uniref:putative olfactory receptor 2B8 n=1 Tax=Alligator mississippiensis TaxID=8496 RepID=UPI002877DA5C|nr:putative olfactory receptor 2B8 [Alligator mississippiensis]